MLSLKVESDLLREVPEILRERRLALGWRQTDLAGRSGVAIATLRRFERSGQITFQGLARLLVSLGMADRFLEALKKDPSRIASLDAFLKEDLAKNRRRARRVMTVR
jgi:transcriptional regulator with XRE-family HTH domain